jgi:hypothetical protein
MQLAASIATVLAAAIAGVALLVGLWQFNRTQQLTRQNLLLQAKALQHEREVKAIELFLKFNELNAELVSESRSAGSEGAFWKHNALLAITESVFRLTAGDVGWRETVLWMLQIQKPFIVDNPINCKTFAPEFIELIKSSCPEMRCA